MGTHVVEYDEEQLSPSPDTRGVNWNMISGTGGPIKVNEWYHMVCSYDGTDPSCIGGATGYKRDYSAIKMHINGVSMIENGQITSGALLNSAVTTTGYTAPPPGAEGPICLGNYGFTGFGLPFQGLIKVCGPRGRIQLRILRRDHL